MTRSPTPGSGPLGIPGAWKLVFDDEFNASSLDTSMWTANWLAGPTCITAPVNPCCEQAAYDPAQVIEANDVLSLTAAYNPVTVNGSTYAYRSGIIQSDGKFQFTYGVIEAYICLPGTNGKIDNWPALWTDGHSWPSDGEMDVMEGLSGNAANHFHSSSGTSGAQVPGNHTGCNTYAAEWEPEVVNYYADGARVLTISSGITSAPMYIVVNYAISSEYGGPLVVPATMQVDYVRVWQHEK